MTISMPDEDQDKAVRNRAYLLWERSGRPMGREHEFWAQAAQELESDEPAGASGKAAAPPTA